MISLVSTNIQKWEQIWRNLHILHLFLAWPLFHMSTTSTPTRPTPTQRRLVGTLWPRLMAQSSVAGPLILPGRASVLGHFPFLGGFSRKDITFSSGSLGQMLVVWFIVVLWWQMLVPSNYSTNIISNARSQLLKHLSSQHKSASQKSKVSGAFHLLKLSMSLCSLLIIFMSCSCVEVNWQHVKHSL